MLNAMPFASPFSLLEERVRYGKLADKVESRTQQPVALNYYVSYIESWPDHSPRVGPLSVEVALST